jgi:hypothetical protein
LVTVTFALRPLSSLPPKPRPGSSTMPVSSAMRNSASFGCSFVTIHWPKRSPCIFGLIFQYSNQVTNHELFLFLAIDSPCQ